MAICQRASIAGYGSTPYYRCMVKRAPQSQDKFIIRLPNGMREKIEALAKANKRTMTGEIIDRLERSFEAEPVEITSSDLESRLRSIEWRVSKIEGSLQAQEVPTETAVRDLAELHGAKRLLE